jgi:hypothetical protein
MLGLLQSAWLCRQLLLRRQLSWECWSQEHALLLPLLELLPMG